MPSSNGIPSLVMLPSGSGGMCSRRMDTRFGRRGFGRSNLDIRGSVSQPSRGDSESVMLE